MNRRRNEIRTRRVTTTIAAVAVVVALGAGGQIAQAFPQAPDSKNFVANGTFQSGFSGWEGGKLTRLTFAPGYKSSQGVRLSGTVDHASPVTLNDSVNSIDSTIAGHVYRASAWVRAEQSRQSVAIRLLEEVNDWRVIGHQQGYQWRTDTDWKHISATYVALRSGSSLDLNVLGMQMKPGGSIVVDSVALVDLSAQPTQPTGPTPAPTQTTDPAPPPTSPPPTSSPSPLPPVVTPSAPPVPTSGAGERLVWSDEFNGSSLDRSNWNVENNSTYGDGNKELACLLDDPQNVDVSGGVLTITARKAQSPIQCGNSDARFPQGRSYTSAMLTTKGKLNFGYGRFEIRAKTPTAQGTSKGLWPAFWMRPQTGGIGELDIMEIIGTAQRDPYSANHVTQTIHYDYTPTYPKQGNGYDLPHGNFADGFHDFAIEWSPGSITWYVDGVATFHRNRVTTPWLDAAFSNDFYLRLNMAVGGTWPGSPDADTAFPAEFQVDYVRVYER